jgi:gamma-glutamyltranspeptidase/glutathione hydrolase
MRVGGMQAIAIDPASGLLTGAADPRRDGYVATA